MNITPDFDKEVPYKADYFLDEEMKVAYLSINEMNKLLKKLEIDEIHLEEHKSKKDLFLSNTVTQTPEYTYATIDIINSEKMESTHDRIGLYVDNMNLIIVDIHDEDESTKKALTDSIHFTSHKEKEDFGSYQELDFGKVLYRFFSILIEPHNATIYNFQSKIEELDDRILKEDLPPSFATEIATLTHKLLQMDDYYDQLQDVVEAIQVNENNILKKDNLCFLTKLNNRLERYSSNNDLLRDYLALVRDSYDSLINLNLNKTMKTFTVITLFFSPLTLIAGWYGMNFKTMPELNHPYGYLYVIVLSVSTVSLLIYMLKKKNLI